MYWRSWKFTRKKPAGIQTLLHASKLHDLAATMYILPKPLRMEPHLGHRRKCPLKSTMFLGSFMRLLGQPQTGHAYFWPSGDSVSTVKFFPLRVVGTLGIHGEPFGKPALKPPIPPATDVRA